MSLKEVFKKEIAPKLMSDFKFKNINATPRLQKIVVNVGFGKMTKEPKILETVESTLKRITGQKPILTKAKKSISNFKMRQGQIIGAKVTLRGQRMYDFLEKLIKITLPRVRDFRGIPEKVLDSNGNLTVGFKEFLPFPEIRPDEVERVHGLEVTIVSNAGNLEIAKKMFTYLGFPFSK